MNQNDISKSPEINANVHYIPGDDSKEAAEAPKQETVKEQATTQKEKKEQPHELSPAQLDVLYIIGQLDVKRIAELGFSETFFIAVIDCIARLVDNIYYGEPPDDVIKERMELFKRFTNLSYEEHQIVSRLDALSLRG